MRTSTMRVRLAMLGALVALSIALAVLLSPSGLKAQYSGNVNNVVPLDTAVKYIHNFNQNKVAPYIKGGYFGRNIFDQILAQHGVIGIRYYYAAKNDGTPTLILVGVDSTGSDMVTGLIGEWSSQCPPFCAPTNLLNK